MTIHLGPPLPTCFSCQPEPAGAKAAPESPPRGPYLALLPVGLAVTDPVASLVVGSYPTVSPLPDMSGSLFSVALSLGLPPPGVTRHRCFVESGLSSRDPIAETKGDHPTFRAKRDLGGWVRGVNGEAPRQIIHK